jgi:opacity protein-like surface antigen
MSPFSTRLTLILFVLAFSAVAHGQEDGWYVAPSIVWFNDDPDRALDESLAGAQVTVGRNLTEYLSLEGLLGYNSVNGYCQPGDCYPDQKHLDFSANLLAFYDRDARFTPYFLLGVGYLAVDADEGPQYVRNTGSDNRPTASVGLGLKWQLGESNYSIRGEYLSGVAFGDRIFLIVQLLTMGVK